MASAWLASTRAVGGVEACPWMPGELPPFWSRDYFHFRSRIGSYDLLTSIIVSTRTIRIPDVYSWAMTALGSTAFAALER